jgi:hypothetical protein
VYLFLQESLKKLEISRYGIIASLRVEKAQLTAQLDERKQKLQEMQVELKQVR